MIDLTFYTAVALKVRVSYDEELEQLYTVMCNGVDVLTMISEDERRRLHQVFLKELEEANK